MSKNIISLLFIVLIFLSSCGDLKKYENQALHEPGSVSNNNIIVYDTITNDDGETIYMSFNNTEATATFILHNDTIVLNHDTMGSGIKYSNEHYIYTEWHGQGELMKDTAVIFKYKDK